MTPLRDGKRESQRGCAAMSGAAGDLLDLLPGTQPGAELPTGWRNVPLKTGFTSHLRNQVVDGSAVLEKARGGKNYFFTLTIPGRGDDVNRVSSAASGYMVNRLNRWLKASLFQGRFLYVWEVQKRGTAHLHYLVQVRRGIQRNRFIRALRREWRGILADVSKSSGTNLFLEPGGKDWSGDARFPVIDVRSVTSSLAKYLGKYCSKSKSKAGASSGWHPGRWGALSYRLQRELRSARDVHVWNGELQESPCSLMASIAAAVARTGATIWRLGDTIEQVWDVMSARPPTGQWSVLVRAVKDEFDRLNERNIPNGQRPIEFPRIGAIITGGRKLRRNSALGEANAIPGRVFMYSRSTVAIPG